MSTGCFALGVPLLACLSGSYAVDVDDGGCNRPKESGQGIYDPRQKSEMDVFPPFVSVSVRYRGRKTRRRAAGIRGKFTSQQAVADV